MFGYQKFKKLFASTRTTRDVLLVSFLPCNTPHFEPLLKPKTFKKHNSSAFYFDRCPDYIQDPSAYQSNLIFLRRGLSQAEVIAGSGLEFHFKGCDASFVIEKPFKATGG
ncbi:MAG: hypothetical protein NTU54_03555 [Candidatus Omnitrophica bacterium]|nr:hypothetical protein [Candidatus Omnitrophota bacterium]